jgi:phosphatidate cytidylyltransferase
VDLFDFIPAILYGIVQSATGLKPAWLQLLAFMKRILTALVALPILLYTIWSPTPFVFVVLVATVTVVALWEFYGLAAKAGSSPTRPAGYVAGLLVLLSFVLGRPEFTVGVLAALAFVTLCLELRRPDGFGKSLFSVSATLFGVVYIGLLMGFLVGVRMIPDLGAIGHLAAKFLTFFLAVVMLTDTGAYYTGRTMGVHKLAPMVSPGKTVEGAIGGLVTGIVAGVACKAIFFKELPVLDALILGALVSLAGQAGDLFESMLKRGSAVKDSSHLIPGHGGMLDRLDSILFAAPLIYYYSRLLLSRH